MTYGFGNSSRFQLAHFAAAIELTFGQVDGSKRVNTDNLLNYHELAQLAHFARRFDDRKQLWSRFQPFSSATKTEH